MPPTEKKADTGTLLLHGVIHSNLSLWVWVTTPVVELLAPYSIWPSNLASDFSEHLECPYKPGMKNDGRGRRVFNRIAMLENPQ